MSNVMDEIGFSGSQWPEKSVLEERKRRKRQRFWNGVEIAFVTVLIILLFVLASTDEFNSTHPKPMPSPSHPLQQNQGSPNQRP